MRKTKEQIKVEIITIAEELLKLASEIETGPENERGKAWFANDGIDDQTKRVAPAC